MSLTPLSIAGAMDRAGVAVIVPAFNASGTVAEAVSSALRQPEVAEVVVVDDASSDGTAEAAQAADDGSGRLLVHRLPENGGPSRARNVAISLSSSPLIAILDSDDRFAANRFTRLLVEPDWDILADNIVFVQTAEAAAERASVAPDDAGQCETLDFVAFVNGNISRRDARRREFGFLHPVMRRAFLEAHAITYNEGMRLGEDYDLYARALLAGARFKLSDMVGYVALERGNSLSGTHRTRDLAALLASDVRLLAAALTPTQRAAVEAHRRSIAARHDLRRFLDDKRDRGMLAAAIAVAGRPATAPAVVSGVVQDKLAAARAKLRRATPDHRSATLIDVKRPHATRNF